MNRPVLRFRGVPAVVGTNHAPPDLSISISRSSLFFNAVRLAYSFCLLDGEVDCIVCPDTLHA